MKLKGINPFEQHVEKIVLGAASAVLLGAVAWQFLGNPNAVTVGSETLPPQNAFQPAERAAQGAMTRMQSQSPELPEVGAQADFLAMFQTKLERGVSPRPRLAGAIGNALQLTDVADVKADQFVGQPVIAGPGPVYVHAYWSTIDPRVPVAVPEVKTLLPAEQPYDKAAVTIEASISGTAIRDVLSTDPDGNGPLAALPTGWWRDSVEILGVEVSREQQQRDGSWSKPQTLALAPGMVNFLRTYDQNVKSSGDVPTYLEQARTAGETILRPKFYQQIAGDWVSPSAAADRAVRKFDPLRVDDLKRQITELDARVAKLREQRAALPDPATERQRQNEERARQREERRQPAGGGDGGGGGRGGRPGGGGPPGGGNRRGGQPEPTPSEGPRVSAASLDANIRREEGRREQLIRELKSMGVDVSSLTNPDATAAPETTPTEAGPTRLLESDSVRVWFHDVEAVPGETYRYRIRAVLNNPVFGRAVRDEQKDLAADKFLRSEWSEAKEVTVDRSEYYFVVGGNPGNNFAGPSARAELFKFYYGYYRQATLSLEPGDVLAGEAKLPDNLIIFDPAKMAQLSFTQPGQPGTLDGGPRRGPRNMGGGPPDLPPGAPGRPGEIGGAPPGSAAQADPNAAAGTPAPKSIPVSADAMLMDVASTVKSGKEEPEVRAILRDERGNLVIRSPRDDESSALYQQLKLSAKAGETQGATPKAMEPAQQPTPGRGNLPPGAPGSGGGGGGGSGG